MLVETALPVKHSITDLPWGGWAKGLDLSQAFCLPVMLRYFVVSLDVHSHKYYTEMSMFISTFQNCLFSFDPFLCFLLLLLPRVVSNLAPRTGVPLRKDFLVESSSTSSKIPGLPLSTQLHYIVFRKEIFFFPWIPDSLDSMLLYLLPKYICFMILSLGHGIPVPSSELRIPFIGWCKNTSIILLCGAQ